MVVVCLLTGILGCHGARDGAVAPNSVDASAAHLRGDLDDDGNPSVADAIGILRIVVGLDPDNPAADADADGTTGIADAIAVLRCVVGLSQWPLGEWRPPATRTVSGTVVETDFVVGANDRVECDGDVVIQCDTATIAGELYAPNAAGSGETGASIRIEAQGDIVVTGEVSAGDGGIGEEDGDGGDGGSVELVSANGNITIGSEASGSAVRTAQDVVNTVAAGNAGDGGDGLLGGAGGTGGSLCLEARNGTVNIFQARGLLAVGNGGDGGDGVVGGEALATFAIPSELENHGGDGGGLVVHCADVAGITASATGTTHEGTPVVAAVLDEGVASGGEGGDAGEFWFGVDPNTGESTWPETVRTSGAVRVQEAITAIGSHGGNGTIRGGDGGEFEVMGALFSMTIGDGKDVHLTGGDGGMAGMVTHGSRGVEVLDVVTQLRFYGGCGGSVYAWGYHGSSAVLQCSAGGRGGDVTAIAGSGGDIAEVAIPTAEEPQYYPGDGGEASARGGRGGASAPCCSPPGPGRAGGRGGNAVARGGDGGSVVWGTGAHLERGAGGDAGATGGDGGTGGQGVPPGPGGNGGTADVDPGTGYPMGMPAGEVPGRDGDPGGECPGPDEPGPGEVKGRLFDPQGNPVAGWGVKNNWLGVAGQSLAGEVKTQFTGTPTVSDGTGRYVYSNVPVGMWQVYPAPAPAGLYWVPSFRFYTKQQYVGVGGQDFQQAAAQQVDVTIPVRDQNGSPVEGATVDMWLQTGLRYSAWTCSLGLAQFTGVWSGYYRAQVQVPAPPPGYEWHPGVMDLDVGTDDIQVPPFQLRPTF